MFNVGGTSCCSVPSLPFPASSLTSMRRLDGGSQRTDAVSNELVNAAQRLAAKEAGGDRRGTSNTRRGRGDEDVFK